MTYFNYLGQAMPETPAETGNISGTSAGNETITAPAGDTSVSGQGGGDLLIGSSGGNRFYLTDPRDRVQETAGGVDTEIGWLPIQLAPNVENLIVHGDFNHGVGNNLDNLITTDGRAWLDGGAGNDVLVGATNTTTTFVVRAGQGNDVIYNWQGADQLQLVGFDTTFKTASDIRAAMSQQGSDVVLNMGGGQSLTFRGVTLSTGFRDVQFLTPLDRSKLGSPTFTDDFNSLNLYDYSHKTGVWQAWFDGNNLKDIWAYGLPSNNEAQAYVNADFEGGGDHRLNINPFSINNGTLSITAQALPANETAETFGRVWSSGMLNTLGTFQQKYGYFEVRAQLTDADGAWPAFWMIPWPYKSGQEGDVMESLGLWPMQDYRRAYGTDSYLFDNTLKSDPNGWHTYGLLWTKDTLTYYRDGLAILTGPTPASWTNPMGLVLNMAMGGWGGQPDPAQFPANINIDYVHAYALADGSTVAQTLTPTTPYGTIIDIAQPASLPAAQTFTFDDTDQPLSSGRIVVLDHTPTAADIPSGRAFLIWQSSGQVRAAVANNGQLDPYTILSAGGSSAFSGAGTFLTDGRVVTSYMGTDNQGHASAWAVLFDPSTRTFMQHELGPSSGQVKFTPLDNGGFAASWHTPTGGVDGRTFDAFAYDSKGWWGLPTDLAGDVSGVTSQGDLIVAAGSGAKTVYDIAPYAISNMGSVSIGPSSVSKPEGTSGVSIFTFTVSRSEWEWQRGTVAWKVVGSGANPATAQDFVGGYLPSGVVSLQGDQTTATITVQVQGDTVAEPNEQFTVQLFNPVGVTLGAVTATGTIQDGGGTGGGGGTPTPPSVSLTTTSLALAEGNSGLTAFTYLVGRTGDASASSTVAWSVAGSGANPAIAADFQNSLLPSGTLTFAAGETSKSIVVNVVGDTTTEPNETFTLTLSNPSGATLGTATASGQITNDDGSSGGGGSTTSGQVYTAAGPGSVLSGGAGNDTFNASVANDTLTGGGGNDVFVFSKEPWSPIHITDFTAGQDKLDFTALFRTFGYTGRDPIGDHWMYVYSDGAGGSILRFDHDGPGPNPQWPNTIIDLEHVAPAQVTSSDWIF